VTTLAQAFDPERFRAEGHQLVDQLADYLARVGEGPVLPWAAPEQRLADWPADFDADGDGDATAFLARVLAQSHALHHPRYIGHQVTSPLPVAALLELVSALLNNSMATYEMGPAATAMERSLMKWLGAQIGWDGACEGVLTSGGSVGNLTALLAARQARAGYDAWTRGSDGNLAVLAAAETHYSIKRSIQIMGLGEAALIPVAVDERFRLRPDALPEALERANGKRVVAVVASAGSTATGAFDPLPAIADFCAAHGLWLHVDGAHGASAALSPSLRPLLTGIERADSVVWDMHKMMLIPSLVTAVLFRDGRHSYEPFAQEASYLFHGHDPRAEWMNTAIRTLECTKRMMSLEVYGALKLCGTRLFADYVEQTFARARRFAERIAAAGDFELAVVPDANIVCFRHVPTAAPDGAADLDELQRRIRRRVVESGRFYIVQTTLPRGVYLRTTIINPRTTDEDLAALLDFIRTLA
jgi:L-2,4-diaminobutyrate decarboxylase